MKKHLKTFSLLWVVNVVAFTVVLFARDYSDHLNHWTENALNIMSVSLGIAKVVLSVMVLACLCEDKL